MLALVLLGGVIGCARGDAADALVERHTGIPGGKLLALGDDQLLLWETGGRAELRTSAGTWTPEFRLPLKPVVAAHPDGEGFLIAGLAAPGSAAVVALSPLGKERRRWTLPGDGALGFVSGSSGVRALTRAGFVTLNPDGTSGAPEAYPPPGSGPRALLPIALREGGGEALCYPADPSMQHRAPGLCSRAGTQGWSFEAQFVEPPISCGEWVIAGDEKHALAAHAWRSGTVAGQAVFQVDPVPVCAGPGELLIGEKRLVLMRLPGFEERWSRQLGGSAPVQELAVLKSLFAYRVDGSLEVVLVPRPGN